MNIVYSAAKMCIQKENTIEALDSLSTKFAVLYATANQLTENEYLDVIARINAKKAQLEA